MLICSIELVRRKATSAKGISSSVQGWAQCGIGAYSEANRPCERRLFELPLDAIRTLFHRQALEPHLTAKASKIQNKVTEAAILLKAPRFGEVKTRLARSIGVECATKIYRALVEHQLAEIPATWRTVIHFAPSDDEAEMRSWLVEKFPANRFDFVSQPNGDLGSRLISAMDHAFASGADGVFFLGGDCPGLTRSYLQEAEAALVETDVIIASARDGGYVLLGLKNPVASIFEGIPWSSEAVFAATLRATSAAGLSFRCLAPLEDVDDLESYERQREAVEGVAGMTKDFFQLTERSSSFTSQPPLE